MVHSNLCFDRLVDQRDQWGVDDQEGHQALQVVLAVVVLTHFVHAIAQLCLAVQMECRSVARLVLLVVCPSRLSSQVVLSCHCAVRLGNRHDEDPGDRLLLGVMATDSSDRRGQALVGRGVGCQYLSRQRDQDVPECDRSSLDVVVLQDASPVHPVKRSLKIGEDLDVPPRALDDVHEYHEVNGTGRQVEGQQPGHDQHG